MLLHRLPLDPSLLGSVTPDDGCFDVAPLRKVDLSVRARLLQVSDSGCLLVVCWLTLSRAASLGQPDFGAGLALSVAILPIWFAASRVVRLYKSTTLQSGFGHFARAVLVMTASLWPAMVFAIATGPGRTLPLAAMLPGCSAILIAAATRLLCQASLTFALRRGACFERVMVLGESVAAARYLAAEIEYQTAGRLRAAVCAAIPEISGNPSSGRAEHALRSRAVDRILIADSPNTHFLLADTHHKFSSCGVDVSVLFDPQAYRHGLPQAAVAQSALTRLLAARHPLSLGQAVAKRCLDIFVAVVAVVMLTPIIIAIALAIQLDSAGPIFFRQKRAGLHGKVFLMWKFRTMYVHLQDEASRQQTGRHDKRVTRVGRLLRRISLDEVPQLFNVLKGDMSIVGPRPHALGMTVAGRPMDDVAHGYADRYRMKPGITGWAQVNGCRGELNEAKKLRRRIALDCYYIENWSLMTDISIMARTAALMIADHHAY